MQKKPLIVMIILGVACLFNVHCHSTSDNSESDSGPDGDTDTDTDSDTDSDSDFKCIPDACCHASGCLETSHDPVCLDIPCDASCQPGTMDCGQGFCDFVDGKCTAVMVNELACSERRKRSNADIAAVLVESLDCEDAGDCVEGRIATDCTGACPVAVAKSGLPVLNNAVSSANYKYCGNFEEDGCESLEVDCMSGVPACVDKKCKMVEADW